MSVYLLLGGRIFLNLVQNFYFSDFFQIYNSNFSFLSFHYNWRGVFFLIWNIAVRNIHFIRIVFWVTLILNLTNHKFNLIFYFGDVTDVVILFKKKKYNFIVICFFYGLEKRVIYNNSRQNKNTTII